MTDKPPDEQPHLPFGKAEEKKSLVPNEADMPTHLLVKSKAKEMFACGWTVREIVAAFRKFPDASHVTTEVINNWRARDNWIEYRRQVQTAIAKDQLTRIKKGAAQIYTQMDKQIVTIQHRLLNALEGLDAEGNMVGHPPQLLSGERIIELFLKSLEFRRSLVADALDRTSESLPLVDPGTLDLFITPRERIVDPPPPEEEEENAPQGRNEAENATGS